MVEEIRQTEPKARKEYDDMCKEDLIEGTPYIKNTFKKEKISFADLRIMVKIKQENYK